MLVQSAGHASAGNAVVHTRLLLLVKVWTQPGTTGGKLGEITALLNGQVSDAATFTLLLAMGFEVGKNCSSAIASSTFTLANDTSITTTNTFNTASYATGVLNVTLATGVDFNNVTDARLCLNLRSPCATIQVGAAAAVHCRAGCRLLWPACTQRQC